MHRSSVVPVLCLAALVAAPAAAQAPRALLPIPFEESAEFGWLRKPVLERRVLDDLNRPASWSLRGSAALSFPGAVGLGGMRVLRVDLQMFRDSAAPTPGRLSAATLRRAFDAEDWRGYNRLSLWVRAEVAGVPTLPLQITLRNDGAEKLPDRYGREGIHYVTLAPGGWQQVVWEIEPLPRDRVTALEIGYWVNRMLAAPGDGVAFEVGGLELQRVEPDAHTGWAVAPGRLALSHSGYLPGLSKTALASGLAADFELLRVDGRALGEVVLRAPVVTEATRLGGFQRLDFSAVSRPGRYVLRAGGVTSRPFAIGSDAWEASLWKTLNFLYGNRCGYSVPGVHGVDHQDWFLTRGAQRIAISGGWHDAGDLSQGTVNTGEATYALFALAERLREAGGDPALVARLLEEGRWGLEWVLRVRFPGGYRLGFASHNLWTNNVIGDADDRSREARNSPNVNFIAAAAEALAYRVLKEAEPALAERSLRTAREDWAHAVAGVEGPQARDTEAFYATRLELAGIGTIASLELYRATGERQYAERAAELARVILASQQVRRVGSRFPLAGFFYSGPQRDTLFHQFHRGNDQAPVVALAQLVEALPAHPEWMRWYAAVARYAEYQKRGAAATSPYGVLPAYVYRLGDERLEVPDSGARHGATREAYRAQVQAGLEMGGGWYLRAFPVWFARRGNYGVLLSQAKALAAAARLRGDSAGLDLAQRQAQWVVGRNPFTQSTMYGEGYRWAQQYSVSSGDFVGSLPVGMQSRGESDLPYWPAQNMYVYKEVWVHPSSRWLWLMADLLAAPPAAGAGQDGLRVSTARGAGGEVVVRASVADPGVRTLTLHAENLRVPQPRRAVPRRGGSGVAVVEWRVRPADAQAPWVAVVVPDGDVSRRREAFPPAPTRP